MFRSVIGFSTASALAIDNRELEPTQRLSVRESVFRLEEEEEEKEQVKGKEQKNNNKKNKEQKKDNNKSKEDEEDKDEQSSTVKPAPFAPFGLLEPLALRQARKSISSVLPRLCELATIRAELVKVESELKALCNKTSD